MMFYVGMLAAVFTTVAFLPQVIKAFKTKHTKDLSLVMYLLFSMGLFLWIVYGFYLGSIPIIVANVITLVFSLFLVGLKIIYG